MPILRSLIDASTSRRINDGDFVVARSANADMVLNDPLCMPDCHLVISRVPTGYELNPVHEATVNGELVTEKGPIYPGDRISIGNTLLAFEDDSVVSELTRVGGPQEWKTFSASILVPEEMKIILGREQHNQVYRLNHVQVSRRHAEIIRSGDKGTIRDLDSSNGAYVNGCRVNKTSPLQVGDVIGVGPFSFEWTGNSLIPRVPVADLSESPEVRATLSCHRLTCSVDSGLNLITDISLRIEPGEFVCIVGPSGAGKSTLLKALSNREFQATNVSISGQVLLNGNSLYTEFERLKDQVAFVPQHELLFEELNLETALRFTAMLRLPADTGRAEIKRQVDHVITTVQLEASRATAIKNLSGGQRKRAALANELVAQPSLLFLDEVTSGLDEQTDREMMRLFRRIADSGKTIICVTHSLACVPSECDRVIGMTTFGRLGFDGSPQDALKYFGIHQIGDIYGHLTADNPGAAEALARAFKASAYTENDDSNKAAAGYLSQNEADAVSAAAAGTAHHYRMSLSRRVQQFLVLLHRYSLRMLLDVRSNLLRVLQSGIVAALLCSMFNDISNSPASQISCAFVLVISSYWFGCNNSAKEIVRERGIFEQERRVVVDVSSYAWSKFTLLSAISVVQSVVLVQLVRYWCGLPGSPLSWSAIAAVVTVAGVALGLAASSISRTEEAAIAAVPILLIPQIILAGAVADPEGINEFIAKTFVSCYWGLESTRTVIAGSLADSSELFRPLVIVLTQIWLAYGVAVFFLGRRWP